MIMSLVTVVRPRAMTSPTLRSSKWRRLAVTGFIVARFYPAPPLNAPARVSGLTCVLDNGLARYRIGNAEPAAQILENTANVIEELNHLRPRGDDALKAVPLAD